MKLRLMVLAFLMPLFFIAKPDRAEACRDCPFPMRLSDNDWLIEEASIRVTLIETDLNSSKVLVKIALRDSRTYTLLATGSGVRYRSQRDFKLILRDADGRRLNGSIYWVQFSKPLVRMRFTCMDNGCSIVRRY